MALHRCYSATRCVLGSLEAASAAPDDDLVFPISINRPVGRGDPRLVPNLPNDVLTIQKALNRFGSKLGGPSPKLVVDGLVGRLTTGAIEKFQTQQLGFTDSKIEPERKTINRINELELAIFVIVKPETIDKIYKQLMPDVHRCVLAADAAILAASRALVAPPGGFNPGAASLALVNRHFKLDKNPRPAAAMDFIRGTVRNMLALVNRNQGAERTFVAAPGRYNFAKAQLSGVLALTPANGVALKGFEKSKAQDGSNILLPLDKILITVPFNRATRDLQIITLIHEMAHYLGGPDGAPNCIDDPPSRSSAPEEIAKLPPSSMPLIAENYGTFAFEAAFRRPAFKILV